LVNIIGATMLGVLSAIPAIRLLWTAASGC
jgi:hypothetical protein